MRAAKKAAPKKAAPKKAAAKKVAPKKVAPKKAAAAPPTAPAATGGDAAGVPALGNPLIAGLNAAGNAEHAADECAGRAHQLRIASLDPDVKAQALSEEIRATNLSGDCAQIEIDLKASKIHVDALPPERVQDLVQLGARLDRQIVVRQLINSGLDAVTNVLTTAAKVKDILGDPSIQA